MAKNLRKFLTKGEVVKMLIDAKVITHEHDIGSDLHGTLYVGDDGIDCAGAIEHKWYRREDVCRLIGFRQQAKREGGAA